LFRQIKVIVILALVVVFGAGCSRYPAGVGPQSITPQVPREEKSLTTVRLVFNGSSDNSSLRPAGAPEVTFQLKLLDAANASCPVILLQKKTSAELVSDTYQAEAEFVGVPALPALARVEIAGGYIVDTTDSKQYRALVGMKDLVEGVANEISLYGEGSKISADVGVNLLERLVAAPANVATLPVPIVATINSVVAGLDLSATSVYDDALLAFNSEYAQAAPADAEFAPPVDYASLAFPKSDSNLSLTVNNFNSLSDVYLVLMNRSASNLTPTWSVARATSSLRANQAVPVAARASQPTAEQQFHCWLREQKNLLPKASLCERFYLTCVTSVS